MFRSTTNYFKLKTYLRLAINRMKLAEKKKTELAQKSRKEIADYISAGKYERAKIRVEHIIREDYMVEGLELIEMYCDLLLSRFGLLQQTKELDASLEEAVSSILWASLRIQSDISELQIVAEELTKKYGKEYAKACFEGRTESISEKVKYKLGVQPPPKILVEKYLIEIAKIYNVMYEPDEQVLHEYQQKNGIDSMLFEGLPAAPGFIDFPTQPTPLVESFPMPRPADNDNDSVDDMFIYSEVADSINPDTTPSHVDTIQPDVAQQVPPPTPPARPAAQNTQKNKPPMFPPARKQIITPKPPTDVPSNIANLPDVPDDLPTGFNNNGGGGGGGGEINFDELSKRFEELKKINKKP